MVDDPKPLLMLMFLICIMLALFLRAQSLSVKLMALVVIVLSILGIGQNFVEVSHGSVPITVHTVYKNGRASPGRD